ncbi:hypothetical protein FACS189421_07510 [Bacteroidia bacterium]|nr:hypothetical protein FACS189421_07510 [Bacteroidia bacterium]GHT03338.1 hypothetical protein FACS189423_04020 [Bacteroidia bacterium]GHT45635.1 hypothetical protein FACS189440_02000 [Bacteroidia bacterium]
MKNRVALIILLILFFQVSIYADESLAKLPSEEIQDQIYGSGPSYDPPSPSDDWWGNGPSTQDDGAGAFVGAPIENGIAPLIVISLLYIALIAYKRRRNIKINNIVQI